MLTLQASATLDETTARLRSTALLCSRFLPWVPRWLCGMRSLVTGLLSSVAPAHHDVNASNRIYTSRPFDTDDNRVSRFLVDPSSELSGFSRSSERVEENVEGIVGVVAFVMGSNRDDKEFVLGIADKSRRDGDAVSNEKVTTEKIKRAKTIFNTVFILQDTGDLHDERQRSAAIVKRMLVDAQMHSPPPLEITA